MQQLHKSKLPKNVLLYRYVNQVSNALKRFLQAR